MKQIKKRGFTLVELVIVIAVIAILAAVLIPTFITVIDNANNSADVQLVRNMNSVFVTDIDADSTATAENLRKLLKDNGITEFETKKSDNIIVYDQNQHRFKLVNLSKAEVVSEADATSGTATSRLGKTSSLADTEVVSTENQLVVAENPFSFADIFKGYTMVSTGGNSFAEAIYKCQGSTKDSIKEGLMWLCNKSKQKETLLESLKTLVGAYVSPLDPGQSGTAAIVVKDETTGMNKVGKFLIRFSDSNSEEMSSLWDDAPRLHKDGQDWTSTEKVLIGEDITELDLGIFSIKTEGDDPVSKGMTVILPNTVEKVTISESAASNLDLSHVFFYGNTEIIHEYAKPLITQEKTEDEILGGARVVDSKTINEIKVAVAEYGDLIHETEFYVANNDAANKVPAHYSAHTDRYYSDLQTALDDAGHAAQVSGWQREVVLTSDYTITGDITIPAGVTLQVPFYYNENYKNFSTGVGDGAQKVPEAFQNIPSLWFQYLGYNPAPGIHGAYRFPSEQSIVDDDLKGQSGYTYDDNCKYRLTIQSGTLTIQNGGAVQVGAVLSHTKETTEDKYFYQGHVSGFYGEIKMENNASIVVEEGGTLRAYGYVKGGSVTANKGSTVYEPLIITDGDRDDLMALYAQAACPFMGYSVLNIQSKFTVYAGALVYLRATMCPGSSNIAGDIIFIGTEEQSGLVNPKEGASVELTYSKKNGETSNLISVNEADVVNLKGDIGKTTVTINGEADAEALLISIEGINFYTAAALFPIPHNFEYVIKGTFNVHNRFVVLPGATVKVEKGGTMNITAGSEFYVADTLYQDAPMNGHKYPTAEQLTSAGYEGSGVLIVNGTLNVAASATMGGIVRSTEAGGTIKLDSGAKVGGEEESAITLNLGGWGYNSCNLCTYTCNLRISDGSQLVQAVAGTTYTSEGSSNILTENVSVKYARAYVETDGEDAKLVDKPDGFAGGDYVLAEKEDISISVNTLKFASDNAD